MKNFMRNDQNNIMLVSYIDKKIWEKHVIVLNAMHDTVKVIKKKINGAMA